jgi:hypothetical protein
MNLGAMVFGDRGLIRATTGRAAVIEREVSALVRHWGMLLNTRIKAKASGRPGPNAPTGDYRRSWTHRFYQQAGTAYSVNGTNEPQGRRLEFGFTGTDSLGRVYDQPPYPHVGPAFNEIEPQLVQAVTTRVRTI